MNLNKAVIIGRLVRDPETKSTPSGSTVANFSVATSRVWNDQSGTRQEKTDFHNIVAWGRLAEIIQQYMTKGSLIMVEGRIETRNYEGQDGVKRYRTEIIANNIQMGPRGTANTSSPRSANEPTPPSASSTPSKKEEEIPTIDVNIDDVPF